MAFCTIGRFVAVVSSDSPISGRSGSPPSVFDGRKTAIAIEPVSRRSDRVTLITTRSWPFFSTSQAYVEFMFDMNSVAFVACRGFPTCYAEEAVRPSLTYVCGGAIFTLVHKVAPSDWLCPAMRAIPKPIECPYWDFQTASPTTPLARAARVVSVLVINMSLATSGAYGGISMLYT